MSDDKPIDVEATTQAVVVRDQGAAVGILRPADSLDRIAEAFHEYQQVCEKILTKDDYQTYEGKPRKKKSAWRKLATAFNVSTVVVTKEIERDENRNVISALFTIEAQAGNRRTPGTGYCEVTEKCCPTRTGQKCRKATWKGHYCCENGCDGRKHWSHANHDIIATAETRAKNRAIADLIGCGEVSAEELSDDADTGAPKAPERSTAKAGQAEPTQEDWDSAKPQQSQATPSKPVSDAANGKAPVFPTAKHLARFLEALGDKRANAESFCRVIDWLLPTESIDKLELRYVPATKEQFDAFMSALAGSEPLAPYPPHEQPITPKKEKPIEVPRDANPDPNAPDAPWRSFPVPFGKHAGFKLADVDKAVLFGFWANFEVETEYNGKPRPENTIKRDEKFREMLDEAGKHYQFRKPEDKK